MIKYCCYYCKYLHYPEKSPTNQCRACYNALGGKDHMTFCKTKDGICAETFTGIGCKRTPATEANKDCWRANKEVK